VCHAGASGTLVRTAIQFAAIWYTTRGVDFPFRQNYGILLPNANHKANKRKNPEHRADGLSIAGDNAVVMGAESR